MNNKNTIAAFLLVSAAFFAAPLSAAVRPLSEIVAALERQGYGPIVDVGFDGGRWDVAAYRQERKFGLKVDPYTGAIVSERVER